jgi:hypothetical protein
MTARERAPRVRYLFIASLRFASLRFEGDGARAGANDAPPSRRPFITFVTTSNQIARDAAAA